MTTQELSSRAKVRQWVREYIDGKEEVQLPELTNTAVFELGKDKKFLTLLATETLRDMVYEIAKSVVHSSRLIVLGDEAVSRDEVKRRSRGHSVFRDWLEHVGDRHIRLLEMTREELLVAADEREKRGRHEIELASLWRTLAQQLEGGQTVGSKYTPEAIEEMHEGLANA